MWERTLQDLIRGLRANKKDESKFIAKAVDEIRNEIKSDDMELKAGAVLKLTYVSCILLLLLLPNRRTNSCFHASSTCWGMTWVGRHSMLWRLCLPQGSI